MSYYTYTSTDLMPVAFHFKVRIGLETAIRDTSFQEVSGLDVKMEVLPVKEGGENRFQYQLPNGIKQQSITLKRGLADEMSPLMNWCKSVLESDLAHPIAPKQIWITLCDMDHDPTRVWVVHNAFPVRWNIDTFNSTKNEVAIETIELAYLYVERTM